MASSIQRESAAYEGRYRNLVESLPHTMFETDSRGRFTFANNNALTLLGYNRDDVPGDLDLSHVIEHNDLNRARRDFRRLLAGHNMTSAEYKAQKKNGAIFPIIVFPSAIFRRNRRVGVRGIAIDLTHQYRLRNASKVVVSQIARAQEKERKRIARDLHDDTAQELATLSLQIDATIKGEETLSPATIERLRWLKTKTDTILEGISHICTELRSYSLEQYGFVPAIESLAAEMINETGINIRIHVTGTERRLSSEAELVLFRIAKETLTNIRKHAQATKVVLAIRFKNDAVRMTVSDNGKGFQVPELLIDFPDLDKLGLISMQERAHLFDGTFRIKSGLGNGTTVMVEIQA
jgi:PAS domain S-box-containing protein